MTFENTPVTYSFQQGHASHTYLDSSTNWEPRFQMPKSIGTTHPNQHSNQILFLSYLKLEGLPIH